MEIIRHQVKKPVERESSTHSLVNVATGQIKMLWQVPTEVKALAEKRPDEERPSVFLDKILDGLKLLTRETKKTLLSITI